MPRRGSEAAARAEARGRWRVAAAAHRQIRAVFVERRFIAQRQLLDEVRRPAEAADAAELVVGYAVQTQRQIVPDGIGEQAGVLPDIGDVPPERGKRKLRQRLAACQNRAVFRLIEPQQQPRQRRFAAAALADDCKRLPRRISRQI